MPEIACVTAMDPPQLAKLPLLQPPTVPMPWTLIVCAPALRDEVTIAPLLWPGVKYAVVVTTELSTETI